MKVPERERERELTAVTSKASVADAAVSCDRTLASLGGEKVSPDRVWMSDEKRERREKPREEVRGEDVSVPDVLVRRRLPEGKADPETENPMLPERYPVSEEFRKREEAETEEREGKGEKDDEEEERVK